MKRTAYTKCAKDTKKNRLVNKWISMCGIFFIFGAWLLVTKLEIVGSYVLPAPERVLDSLWKMAESGELFTDVAVSFGRVIKGFLIAFLLAFFLGMLQFLLPKVEMIYEYVLEFFRNVPPLSLIPPLILWCGIGELTKTIIIVLAAFFPMYLNIGKGFSGCDKGLLEVGEVFGYTPLEKFTKIVFPSALADILVGMRIGMGYSWRAIIGAEMVAASSGLGHMILFAQQMSRTDKVIIGIFTIGLVGLVTDRLFGWMIRKHLR